MKNLIWILAVVFVAGCASSPKIEESSERVSSAHKTETVSSVQTSIDAVAIQRSLGLDRDPEQLGFQEKSFDTCSVGYGYSSSHDCQKQNFVVIHFRLQCRETEGTVSRALTSVDLTPIADRDVKWTLPGQQGTVRTDGSGYGQIRGIFSKSQKQQRLKLATNGEFLYMRAGEINSVVTPKSWCPF